jgi:hypothetical protein
MQDPSAAGPFYPPPQDDAAYEQSATEQGPIGATIDAAEWETIEDAERPSNGSAECSADVNVIDSSHATANTSTVASAHATACHSVNGQSHGQSTARPTVA